MGTLLPVSEVLAVGGKLEDGFAKLDLPATETGKTGITVGWITCFESGCVGVWELVNEVMEKFIDDVEGWVTDCVCVCVSVCV